MHAELVEILIAMAPIQLKCTLVDCDHGAAAARYKTPALEEHVAILMLNNHREDTHARVEGVASSKVVKYALK